MASSHSSSSTMRVVDADQLCMSFGSQKVNKFTKKTLHSILQKYDDGEGVFFWSFLAFTREYRESELHSWVINVMKTTMRHWVIVLPNGTINVNFLNIHLQGSLYIYR